MINLERLQENPEPDPNELPLATDHEVRMALIDKIENFTHVTHNRFRLTLKSEVLFDINGGQEKTYITTPKGLLTVENERAQELGIQIMTGYGLQADKPMGIKREETELTYMERIAFASSEKNIVYVRHVERMKETDDPVYLAWQIKDVGPEKWLDRVRGR